MKIRNLFLVFSISLFLVIMTSLVFAAYEGMGEGYFGQGHFGLDSCNSCGGGSDTGGSPGSLEASTTVVSSGIFVASLNNIATYPIEDVKFTSDCLSGDCKVTAERITAGSPGYSSCSALLQKLSAKLKFVGCHKFTCSKGQFGDITIDFSLPIIPLLDQLEISGNLREKLLTPSFDWCNSIDIGLAESEDEEFKNIDVKCSRENNNLNFVVSLPDGQCSYLVVGVDEESLQLSEALENVTEPQPNISDLELEEVEVEEPSTSRAPLYIGLIVLIVIIGIVFFLTRKEH